jgi:hypothetical protein
MVHGDRLNLVVAQEPRHPGVMSALSSLVMQCSPAHWELLPAADLPPSHLGHRNTLGSAPPRVNLAIGGDRHAHPHVERLLAAGILPPPRRQALLPSNHVGRPTRGQAPGNRLAADAEVHPQGADE